MAQPLAVKELNEQKVKESNSDSDSNDQVLNVNTLRLKAGQALPGGGRSTLSLAQGALGKTPIGRMRWFERRKLGIDKTQLWSEL